MRATLEPSPRRIVGRLVVDEGAVIVLVVAEREHSTRTDPPDQPGGLPVTVTRPVGTCDITGGYDHGVSHRHEGPVIVRTATAEDTMHTPRPMREARTLDIDQRTYPPVGGEPTR